MLRERRIGIEHMVAVDDRHGLGNAGQHIFHQPRFGRPLPAAGMGHNDRLAQFRIESAVSAFDRKQASARGRHGGMERTARAWCR